MIEPVHHEDPSPLDKRTAIGGYFALEGTFAPAALYETALKFQSARAAFSALLKVGGPKRVWVPRYICNSMLAPLQGARIEICFYDLREDFDIDPQIRLKASDWLLYVNYFGLCDAIEQGLLRRFNPEQLVMDHAQALFSPAKDCLATIYSPRKFLGIPDGGLLFSRLSMPLPGETDNGSVDRCRHLLLRADGKLQAGYQAFKAAEATLEDFTPKRMSSLSRNIFHSSDIQGISLKRRQNFQILNERFGSINKIRVNLDRAQAPLCYPLWFERPIDRARLAQQNIFIPVYWHEVFNRSDSSSVEYNLALNCLPLPCDQRYGFEDIERLVTCLHAELSH